MAIIIPAISPVAISILGFGVRWYALAYIAAFVLGFLLYRRFMRRSDSVINLDKKQFDDLFTAVILGVILGGRLGYVLFYNLPYFLQNPAEIFAVWHGGMSFHGGLLGVFISVIIFARKISLPYSGFWNWYNKTFNIMDLIAVVAPVGLFFGRIANFVNMEVMGRETDKAWGVVFDGYDTAARHASPLYEAATEGILLFIIMICLLKFTKLNRRAGALAGIFTILYSVFRIFCEQFRAPDTQIGFLTTWGLTMGQLLSGLMLMVGILIFVIAIKKK